MKKLSLMALAAITLWASSCSKTDETAYPAVGTVKHIKTRTGPNDYYGIDAKPGAAVCELFGFNYIPGSAPIPTSYGLLKESTSNQYITEITGIARAYDVDNGYVVITSPNSNFPNTLFRVDLANTSNCSIIGTLPNNGPNGYSDIESLPQGASPFNPTGEEYIAIDRDAFYVSVPNEIPLVTITPSYTTALSTVAGLQTPIASSTPWGPTEYLGLSVDLSYQWINIMRSDLVPGNNEDLITYDYFNLIMLGTNSYPDLQDNMCSDDLGIGFFLNAGTANMVATSGMGFACLGSTFSNSYFFGYPPALIAGSTVTSYFNDKFLYCLDYAPQ
ncbi:MAG: hypothetical protein R2831_11395 [Chitinophagaceae bacterium]